MPNVNRNQTVYLTTGNPDTLNDSSLFRGGELGLCFDVNDRAYQIVQCDSGATAATATGVVAANQVAFWKDRSVYLVTNNTPVAQGGQTTNAYRNEVAGIFRTAVTAGNFCAILVRGRNIAVKSDGNGGVGQTCIANSGTAADVTNIAVGSAITYRPLGIMTGAAAGGNINVDLDLQNIP